MHKIKILLVDDHSLFREALNRWLEGEPDLEMTGHCASVGEGIEILRRQPVDIVLLDHDLGKERGFQFLMDARQCGFAGRVLIVTAGMTDAESVRALDLGANGIFFKCNSPEVLAGAIRRVIGGETWLDASSVHALVEAAKRPENSGCSRPFTKRETQVLQGVFEGLSNKEIGARLGISESSVKAALRQLFQKTGVRTRSQLVRIALEERNGSWLR
jgi:DNA-binding NarL/FixJ family response regulator